MAKINREKTKLSTKIFSGIFFLAGLAVLVLIGVSLGKEFYRKKQIQKEIDGLQAQINQLKQENENMENLIGYLSSTDFQEKEAREKLNLQKNDEKMIVLQKDILQLEKNREKDDNHFQISPENENDSPLWQKWWKYFFGKKSKTGDSISIMEIESPRTTLCLKKRN